MVGSTEIAMPSARLHIHDKNPGIPGPQHHTNRHKFPKLRSSASTRVGLEQVHLYPREISCNKAEVKKTRGRLSLYCRLGHVETRDVGIKARWLRDAFGVLEVLGLVSLHLVFILG